MKNFNLTKYYMAKSQRILMFFFYYFHYLHYLHYCNVDKIIFVFFLSKGTNLNLSLIKYQNQMEIKIMQ
jgi:hypothetical protein